MPWFRVTPALLLGALLSLTALAALIETIASAARRRALRALAARWRMTYSAHDRLRVGVKLSGRFPVPGAADLYVTDLIYGSQGNRYRYVFTAHYTMGVISGKKRQVRVATFEESRDRQAAGPVGPVALAPEDLPLLEQYERLAPSVSPALERRHQDDAQKESIA